MIRFKIIFYFIFYCIILKTKPWRFFQLNAKYFNEKKGIFSKYEIEQYIPQKWRLKADIIKKNLNILDQKKEILSKFKFPLFLKPEWGQNSHGVRLINSGTVLEESLKEISRESSNYIYQEVSDYKKEFEILYTRDSNDFYKIFIHSIVISRNSGDEINSIHKKSMYKETIGEWKEKDIEKLKKYINEIGEFYVARIGLKADNIEAIIKGNFKIFEINIFIPMILSIFDKGIPKKIRLASLKIYVKDLAKLTKNIPKKNNKSIFFCKIFTHYRIKLDNNVSILKIKKIIYKYVENKFMHGCSDYNSLEVRRNSRSKKQAREMFEKNNIPYAKGVIFYNPYTAYKFIKQNGFPICIKPNIGGYSRGSFFPINTWEDFWKAMFFVKLWWPSSVVEKYLLGKNYRVVVTKTGGVEIVMERYPSFVVGDGKKTIGQLIDYENKIREKMELTPIIHLIEKSYRIKNHLKKQGLKFESILEKEKKISLYHRVALAPGGILEDVDISKIPEKNKEIFIKILNLFNSNIFGIDLIMEVGIETDLDKQKCIFLEVNSRPYLDMHRVPRYGKPAQIDSVCKKLDRLKIDGRGVY